MATLFERDYEWFEIWHHWYEPHNLAIVCKFRNDDAILLYSLVDSKVWLKSPDYEAIKRELEEDEYSQVRGRMSEED